MSYRALKLVSPDSTDNLHGMPGILGTLIAIMVVPGIAGVQFIGIIVSVTLALGCGLLAGKLIKATGTTQLAYEDSDEFTHLAPRELNPKAIPKFSTQVFYVA